MAEQSAAEFEPVTVAVQAHSVAKHPYYVVGQAGPVSIANQGFNANGGFVVTAEDVMIFDALGTPALGHRLTELIAAQTSQPVRHVVISH